MHACSSGMISHRRDLQVAAALQLSSTVTSLEFLAVKLTTKHRRVNVVAVAVYRPQSSSRYRTAVGNFCVEFSDLLDEVLTLPGEPLLRGDLNCPRPGPPSGSVDPHLLDTSASHNLAQRVAMATHAGGTLLDLLIAVDGSRLVSRVDVVAVGCLDHDLVVADMDVDRPRPSVC